MEMEASQDPMAIAAADLIDRYGFDVGAFSAQQLVGYWLRSYPAQWIRAAVVEALYQGRYKSVSVGQILAIWKRRGQPIYHYGFEFERMVCGNLSRIPTQEVGTEPQQPSAPAEVIPADLSPPAPPPDIQESASCQETQAVEPEEKEPSALGEVPGLDGASEAIAPPSTQREATASSFEMLTPAPSYLPEEVSVNEGVKHPIHQFVPDPEISLFYEKLRAVVQDQHN